MPNRVLDSNFKRLGVEEYNRDWENEKKKDVFFAYYPWY